MSSLNALVNLVKTNEHYVPRGYKTIGGMWTVDTWRKDDVVVRLMDEGYTVTVSAPGLEVVDCGGVIVFKQGNDELLERIFDSLCKSQSKE